MAKLAMQIPEMPLRNSVDICELLGTTISQVRSGKLQPRTATAVGYLANILSGRPAARSAGGTPIPP